MSQTIRAQSDTRRATQATWSHLLQRRVMRLLSQLDEPLFRGQFRTFYAQSELAVPPFLRFYDRYLRLLALSDELLDDIVPRIQTELSLQSESIELQESAPTRGEIDWSRTLQRNFDELPDAMPLRFDTTMRRQSTANAENLFMIAVLRTYQQELQSILSEDAQDDLLSAQEQQQLSTLSERLERLLANPQLRSLILPMSSIDIEPLAAQVAARLRPGTNPYRDLVAWWEQFQSLRIGCGTGRRQLTFASKRQDAEAEQSLYELWLALALIQLLQRQQALLDEAPTIEMDHISFRFAWQERHFIFHYRRETGGAPSTVTSTYTIECEQPLTIYNGETLIWREPILPLRVVYAVRRNVAQCEPLHQAAIQRLFGEMHLLGNRHGLLLSANLADIPATADDYARTIADTIAGTDNITGKPEDGTQHYLTNCRTRSRISEYRIVPDDSEPLLEEKLEALLQQSVAYLPVREPPACHGILIDSESINVSRDRLISGTVLCPKPHIGPDVVDIVDIHKHCLKDPRLCHVYGQQIPLPFVIRASTLDDVNQQGKDLRQQSEQALKQAETDGDEGRSEQLISTIFLGVGRSVERYVQQHGNTAAIEARYENWIFGEYWKDHERCLAEETRNILLSADYVWDEYLQNPQLRDWAAPAIQYCRALETEIRRRIYNYYPEIKGKNAHKKNKNKDKEQGESFMLRGGGGMTLGAVLAIVQHYRKAEEKASKNKELSEADFATKNNWELFQKIVARSHCSIVSFEAECRRLGDIVDNRNALAHGEPVPQEKARQLSNGIIGYKGKPGFLVWLAENIEPKM